jgi:hypothetical protein
MPEIIIVPGVKCGAYQVTTSQRDDLKKNHPVLYADLLELVIAGKVVITNDAAGGL